MPRRATRGVFVLRRDIAHPQDQAVLEFCKEAVETGYGDTLRFGLQCSPTGLFGIKRGSMARIADDY